MNMKKWMALGVVFLCAFSVISAPANAQDPDSIAGLLLWLKGEDFTDATNVWLDSSPNAFHVDEWSGNPSFGVPINGNQTAHFSAMGGDALHGPSLELSPMADITTFLVYGAAEGGGRLFSQYAGGSTVQWDMWMGGGFLNARMGNTSGMFYLNAADTGDTSGPGAHLASATYFGTNSQGANKEIMELRVDGVLNIDNTPEGVVVPDAPGTKYTVGAIGPTGAVEAHYTGDIGEVIVYDSALGELDRLTVENYLLSKYGMAFVAPTIERTWDVDGSGEWTKGVNWSPNGAPLTNASVAIFGDKITSGQTVYTNTAVTVNEIQFNHSQTYNIAGLGSVNLAATTDASPLNPSISVQGNHQFQALVGLHNDTTATIASDSTLTFNNALNLNGNTLTKTGTGKMSIRNDLLTGGGAVIIQEGTVSGNGTVSGDVNNEGGIISPGNSLTATSAVPEPGTWLLTAVGLLCLVAPCRLPRNSR